MRFTGCFLLAAGMLAAQITQISGEKIRAHTKFLASDLLEGRSPGDRGGKIATEYLVSQMRIVGAKPAGDNGTYLQKVPLVGVTTKPGATLTASKGSQTISFRYLDDFAGQSREQTPASEWDGDAVFVGHGISAPEYNWDDYKGVDVKGKVVVLFTAEPPSDDPKFFKGKALTYYGRWTYKFEEAARRGAKAAVIIHTTPTASYGWEVVRSSWGREDPQVKRAASDPALAFAGWVTGDSGNRLLAMAGRTVEELLKAADTRGFQPFPLGIRISGRLESALREIETENVVAMIEGSDPKLKAEAVVFSAHWDHLGVGEAVDGDRIYNGAVDNATGCAMVIEIARAWMSLPQKPRRSAMFLFVTAEEGGLRGSEYFGQHPVIPTGKIALNLNFDAFYPFGRTSDTSVLGAERTTAWPIVQEAAKRFNLVIKPDPRPEQGSYYRSDHFSMARVGVPAFSIHGGNEYLGKPSGYGEKMFREYNSKSYHQPSDEYKEDWDFAGMEQMAQFGMLIGINVANHPRLPTWKPGDEFLPARQKSGVR